ncbi:TonB-dependent receptor plug domain-containing protein [Acidobacteriota bacterium]
MKKSAQSLEFSDKDKFFVSFYNGKDDLDNSREMNAPSIFQDRGIEFNSNITDLTEWGNTGVSLNWSRDWADFFTSELTASYSKFFNNRERNMEMEISIADDVDFPQMFKLRNRQSGLIEDNDVNDLTLRWNNIFHLSQNNLLEWGIQFTKHDISYNFDTQEPEETEEEEDNEEQAPPRPFFNVLDRSSKAQVIAGYIQDQWTFFDRLTFTPGIRLTYFDLTEDTYFEPRFSFSLNLTEQIKLKGAWGKYYQFVSRIVREDVFQGNREFWSLADGDSIPVGSAVHYIAGLSFDTKMFLFDCELYYKDLAGLAEFAPRSSVFFQDIDSAQFFYQGTGVAKGLEFLLQKKYGDLTGWISYTLGSVEYNFPDLSDALFPATQDQTHELKVVGMYEIADWTFSATWIYATGKSYTPPEGIETITLPSGRTLNQVVIGDKNSARLPDYKRLDLSANYRFMMGDWKATIGASLFNVLDWTNVWYKEFDVIEGEIVETDVTLMGMTFNVFLNVRF